MKTRRKYFYLGFFAVLGACEGSSSVVAPGGNDAAEVGTDAPQDVAEDLSMDVRADVTTDVGTDVATDVGMDVAADTGPDVAPDAVSDAREEVAADAVPDGPGLCRSDMDCAGRVDGLRVCDVPTGSCVGCNVAPDTCLASQHCDASLRLCVPGCRSDEGCVTSGGMGGGGADSGLGDSGADAGGAATNRCVVSTHTCVECVTDEHCPLGRQCMGNVCVVGCSATRACPSGQTCCAGGCIDPLTSSAHCGACGMTCALPNASSGCAAGRCAVTGCADGFGDCDSSAMNGCETDLRTATASCGMCGNACAARPQSAVSCAAGRCVYACNAGFGDCDMSADNGCEVNLQTAEGHCGGCGMACSFPHAAAGCAAGGCVLGACASGFGNCDGMAANGCETEVNTTANCGGCGTACATPAGATARCASGACGFTCDPGFGDCDGMAANGCEVDLRTSPVSCGMCGAACATRAHSDVSCVASACVYACQTGFLDCDTTPGNGCEVNSAVNTDHCGRCGNACASGAMCAAGVCSCPLGASVCAGRCVSLTADPDNCGACGTVCPGTQVCVAGSCVPTCSAGSTLCGDRCVLLGSDLTNCGVCGRVCPTENSCSGGVCTPLVGTSAIGCADGQREGFTDATRFPNIAACAGGWTVPGIFPAPSHSTVASCATNGDDSTLSPVGTGCSSADLCAPGWHLCHGGEVRPRAAGGCADSTYPAGSFFAAAVSGTGCVVCALLSGTVTMGCNSSNCIANCREDPTLNNDFFGCGSTGGASTAASCDGLDRFSDNNCGALPTPWSCGGSVSESITVTKPAAAAGGVMCCR